VERILDEFPKFSRTLADTCDDVGRTVLQLSVPEVTKLIIQSINLFKRYDFNRQAHHKSATCAIHLGSDYEDGITGTTKVALKFMSNKEQFLSEINSRETAKFDKQYVVGVMNKFDSDEDKFVKSQLENFGFSQYPYVLVRNYY
jgi:phosphopentomutase